MTRKPFVRSALALGGMGVVLIPRDRFAAVVSSPSRRRTSSSCVSWPRGPTRWGWSSRTPLQQAARAFAAELLAPADV